MTKFWKNDTLAMYESLRFSAIGLCCRSGQSIIGKYADCEPMRSKTLIAAVVLVFIMTAMPIAADNEDSTGASTTYYITGYVVEALQSENSPLKDVSVSIFYNNTVTSSDVTDEHGFFSIAVTSTDNLQIKFEKDSYTVRAAPDCFQEQEGSSYCLLDLAGITPKNNTYLVTSSYTGLHCVIMGSTTGYISGSVSYTGGSVIGATVTLVSASTSTKYVLTTDEDGTFYLSSCPTGNYYMSVTCNGFNSSGTIQVTVSDDTEPQLITLTKADITLFLGMDAAHFLMALGVLFGVLISISMILLTRHKTTSISVVDDTPEPPEEED